VLAGSSVSDDFVFPESTREQNLPQGIIDMVTPGMDKVFSLEVYLCTFGIFGQILCEMRTAWTANGGVMGLVFFPESRVPMGIEETGLQRSETIHQGFRDVLTSELAKFGGEDCRLYFAAWRRRLGFSGAVSLCSTVRSFNP
jgi:hypothetical protein